MILKEIKSSLVKELGEAEDTQNDDLATQNQKQKYRIAHLRNSYKELLDKYINDTTALKKENDQLKE